MRKLGPQKTETLSGRSDNVAHKAAFKTGSFARPKKLELGEPSPATSSKPRPKRRTRADLNIGG